MLFLAVLGVVVLCLVATGVLVGLGCLVFCGCWGLFCLCVVCLFTDCFIDCWLWFVIAAGLGWGGVVRCVVWFVCRLVLASGGWICGLFVCGLAGLLFGV